MAQIWKYEGVAVAQNRLELHPVIPEFYAERAQRLPFVRDLFNTTAPHYDAINQIFSPGSGRRYRRQCLLRAGLRPGMRLIDVATGTGLLAQEPVSITESRRNVIGVDLGEGMLAIARDKLGSLIEGTTEALPHWPGSNPGVDPILLATIENCVPAEIVLQAMSDSGFQGAQCKVDLDLFRSFVGRKW